jgi:hypothetical protein
MLVASRRSLMQCPCSLMCVLSCENPPCVSSLMHSDGVLQITDALALADYQPVNGYYVAFKTAACCDGGAQVFVQWVLVTASGKQQQTVPISEQRVVSSSYSVCRQQPYTRTCMFRSPG